MIEIFHIIIFPFPFQSHNRTPPSGNSLFNELEMSLSEADMNLHHNSTPLKRHTSDDDMYGDDVPDIYVTTPNNREISRVSYCIALLTGYFEGETGI